MIRSINIHILSALLLLFCNGVSAQHSTFGVHPTLDTLYKLDKQVRKGDKNALLQLASYTADTTPVIDRLGYHEIYNLRGNVAHRLIYENSFFLPEELGLIDTLIQPHLYANLLQLKDDIYFDRSIAAFLVTPLEKRVVKFEAKQLTPDQIAQLALTRKNIMNADWIKNTGMKKSIKDHDPLALALAAKELLRVRGRYNESDFEPERFTNAIGILTGISIGIEGGDNMIIHKIDYSTEARLNYATYWLTHYKDYSWDKDKQLFINTKHPPDNFSREHILFKQMSSSNDTVAMSAFLSLTEIEPDTIKKMLPEFRDYLDRNYALPTFRNNFLLSLSKLTKYCRKNNISYKNTSVFNDLFTELGLGGVGFTRQYYLEEQALKLLTLDNLTSFEYWVAAHESSWNFSFSTGRMLDIFYSKNMRAIIADKKQLALYLKKAKLFIGFGIIGSCGNYLGKLTGTDSLTINMLTQLDKETTDPDIKWSIEKLLSGSFLEDLRIKKENNARWIAENISKRSSEWPDNFRIPPVINDLKDSMSRLSARKLPKKEKEQQLEDLAFLATYEQIDVALGYYINEKDYWNARILLYDQFDILDDSIESKDGLQRFLQKYHSMDELSLYKYYLKQSGIDIWATNDKPDYDKIYFFLKHGLCLPFAGGGGKERSRGIFSVVRLLEAEFSTRLGVPRKSGHNQGSTFSDYSEERRRLWMDYIKSHGLLTKPDNEPPSFVDFED